jgi:hypothetical protein
MTYAAKRNLVDESLEDFKSEGGGDFLHWVYDVLFDLEEGEIPSDELVEGAGEKQIDVIKVQDDTENRKARIHVLQTKKTSGFSANTVVLISNGLKTIFESKKADVHKLINKTLAAKILEIRDVLKNYGFGSVELCAYYVTLGNSDDVGQETNEAIANLESKFSSFGFENFSFKLLGASELYDLWWQKNTADRKIGDDIKIIYDVNRPSIIEFTSEGYKAVVCTVSGQEIARLASLEPKDAIFDTNLRDHLGLGGRVNGNILAACQKEEEAKTFWLKNNGITMVCSHFDVIKDPDDPVVKVKNVQIINGCQTSVTLREAAKEGKLSQDVRVLAKIYQLQDAALISKIVLATNNQNSIVSRDLYSNDECQSLIQQAVGSKLGMFYERKRGEARSKGRSRSETIDSEKAGQAYLAIKKKLPTVSRAQKYRIYESDLYDDVFKYGSPLEIALCYYIYEFCKRRGLKEAKQKQKGDNVHSLLTYGVFHLARTFAFFLFEGEELEKDESKIISAISALRNEVEAMNKPFKKAVSLCTRVLKRAKAASANNYFKSQLSQQQITTAIGKLS